MKMLVFLFSIMLAVIVLLMALVNNAFAQETSQEAQAKTKQHTVRVAGQEGKDTEMVLTSPGPGENLTVIVEVPVRTRKPATRVTNITHMHAGSNLRLRGGVGMGVLMSSPAEMVDADMTVLVGLIGEVGYTDSPWRFHSRFNLGKCQDGNMAVGGDLAALLRLSGGLFGGAGANMLYCADTDERPRELGKKRLVGGSIRFAYEEEYRYSSVIVELSLGLESETAPVPGGRKHEWLGAAGLSVLYLF